MAVLGDGSLPDNECVAAVVRRESSGLGIEEYEAYSRIVEEKKVIVQPNGGRGMSATEDKTLFIRVIDDGRIGTAFTNDYHDGEIVMCLRRAKKLARLRNKDPSLKGFAPSQNEYRQVGGLNDKEVATMELSTLDSLMDVLINSALDRTEEVCITGSEMSAERSVTRIINSNGVDAAVETSRLSALCATVSGKGDRVSPECLSHAMSRSGNLQLEKLGRMGADIASFFGNEVEPATEECAVVLSPMAAGMRDSGLLTAILANALSGMQVLHEGSPFVGRLGEEIASRDFALKDAPLMPGRVGSRPFDDEGTATRDRQLVREGVLEGFVWDEYYGTVEGSGSTGNAVRNAVNGAVVPAPMNLTVSGGGGDLFDLVSEVDHGYLVWGCQGAHTSNMVTGDFSFVASPGFKIERGEIVGGVKGAMVSGNIIGLLGNVSAVGNDRTDFGSSFMPSMTFCDVKITTG